MKKKFNPSWYFVKKFLPKGKLLLEDARGVKKIV